MNQTLTQSRAANAVAVPPSWSCEAFTHGSESEWLEDRSHGIGASETSSIFGVGYAGSSPITVYGSKIGKAEPIDAATQRLFDRSHLMESVIAAELRAETEWEISDPGDYTIFRSSDPKFSKLFSTLDRIAIHPEFGPIPAELKNINGRFWRDWDGDEAPLKHVVQTQHQMAVTGASHAILAGLIGGSDLKYFVIERNDKFIDAMTARLNEFWDCVISRTLPDVDESEATAKALFRIYPEDSGLAVNLPDDFAMFDARLKRLKEAEMVIKKNRTAIENKIKAAIGDATYGVLPGGGKFSWKLQVRAGYVVQQTEFRVLRRLKK